MINTLSSLLSFILLAAGVTESLSEWGDGAHQRVRRDSSHSPIPLCTNQRLTISFPARLRSAIPGRAGALRLTIRGETVVVERSDSLLSTGAPVSVNFLFVDDHPLHLAFSPAERCPLSLLELLPSSVSEERSYSERALRRWGALPLWVLPDTAPPSARALTTLLRPLHQSWLLRTLAQEHLQDQLERPVRSREGLLYLTLERVLSDGDGAILIASLRNESQPIFSLQEVSVACGQVALRPVSWESDGLRLAASQAPLRIALRSPCRAEVRPLTLRLCAQRGRCVSLNR